MVFLFVSFGLGLTAIVIFIRSKKSVSSPKSLDFKTLQESYLAVYYLASFSDWLQGPYVYKVYSNYGYKEEEIAFIYIMGFVSSSFFGTLVGHIADRYGRKKLCMSFGIFYTMCCLTKLFSNFYILLLGQVLGGISTSILFPTFEAWYINEHVNHHNLPPEWLNVTFSEAGSFTGFLAIVAGILSQIFVETLNFGPVSPFIFAIPFLMFSTYLIAQTWQDRSYSNHSKHQSFVAPLNHMFVKDPILLVLGFIQALFESGLYTFFFSWTPIISDLNPPLGIVFASFMLAFMIGSEVYSMLISHRFPPQLILVLTCILSFITLSIITLVITYMLHFSDVTSYSRVFLTQTYFYCFILYEFSVGLYVPAISYIKSKVVPEEHRASITNWFRLPTNFFTCVSLMLTQLSEKNVKSLPKSVVVFKKFQLIYTMISVFLLISSLASIFFSQEYTRRHCGKESINELSESSKASDPARSRC